MCLIAQFYVALFPIGGTPNAEGFFEAYLAAPIVLAFFIFWKILKRTKYVRLHEIDLVSGRRELDLKSILEEEREQRTHWVWYKK
jgi:amino acid transporter